MEKTTEAVRTRFAPSPTGHLHVGAMRTAIFTRLLAAQAGEKGTFILRIEDTDQKREVEGSVQHIIESLGALGITYQEGPRVGGPHAPYTQSERVNLGIYQEYAKKLIGRGRAYADPYTPEEVQEFRKQAQAAKQPFLYRRHRPENPPEWNGSQPLRFKSEPKDYTWTDAIMGEVSTGPEAIDDFILIKADGFPTYNFAHIVDDQEMYVTHIIRGQEFVSSTPNYLNLYEALEIQRPVLASAPPILAEDGKRKLGKRDNAKDILDYIREGYLPETLVNFIVSHGWNDGSKQEIFNLNDLAERFRLEDINKSGARFDETKLAWMSGVYIRERISLKDLYDYSRGENFFGINYWPAEAEKYEDEYRLKTLGLVQERLKYFAELPELTAFFFKDFPVNPKLINDHKQLKKFEFGELKDMLQQAENNLRKSDFAVKDLTHRLNDLLERTGQKPAVLFSLIRIATTQAPASPGLAETLSVLGKERSLNRIAAQLEKL